MNEDSNITRARQNSPRKSNVYTRTGDTGTTSLASGQRVPKTNARLEAYGTLDELNSFIGLLMSNLTEEADRNFLLQVQNHLFSLGSRLATDAEEIPWRCSVDEQAVADMEHAIDEADQVAGGWRGFVLPGGCQAASLAHVCRTVCRRLERRVYAMEGWESLEPELLQYVNRLSDYFFILAKKQNILQGVEEKIWKKRS
ncbi:MAG: cob(I)yrinic acid a,c-diamide adenosyltransferase [Prevotellaceae bacterium]|nr:cob(I)yrinic acid a,c-diamide adenosyltransferase [Prevotellaceae bacterium]